MVNNYDLHASCAISETDAVFDDSVSAFMQKRINSDQKLTVMFAYLVGCVAQLAERRSLAGELTLSCTRPAADG